MTGNRIFVILVFVLLSFSGIMAVCISTDKPSESKTLVEQKNRRFTTHSPETPPPAWKFLFDSTYCFGFQDPFSDRKFNSTIRSGGKFFALKITRNEMDRKIIEEWTCPSYPGIFSNEMIYSSGNGQIIYRGKRENHFYILINYPFLENGKLKSIQQEIYPLDSVWVKTGDQVNQKSILGTLPSGCKEVSFTVQFPPDKEPFYREGFSWYLKEYHHLTDPNKESVLLVVVKNDYRVHLFMKGKHQSEYDICLGQEPSGHKQIEGDNRTPEGEYHISEKEKGPFYTGTGPYLGERWMHFSYPNRYDAEIGFRNGVINKQQRDKIISDDKAGIKTNNYTKLGGRIGLHGWINTFTVNGYQNLTWGCVCMQNEDIKKLFDQVPMNTKLIILP